MTDKYLIDQQDDCELLPMAQTKCQKVTIDVGFGRSLRVADCYDIYDFYEKANIRDESITPFVKKLLSNVNNSFYITINTIFSHSLLICLQDESGHLVGEIDFNKAVDEFCRSAISVTKYYRQGEILSAHSISDVSNNLDSEQNGLKYLKEHLESMLSKVNKTIKRVSNEK